MMVYRGGLYSGQPLHLVGVNLPGFELSSSLEWRKEFVSTWLGS